MELKGAEIVMECLKKEGVDTIFGYPGGAVIPLYDALYKYKEHFYHILTSHEQGASHAADGYARSSGKAGVCIATSGPGATNMVTGIATAYADSVPMVIITGQVASSLIGRDSFQEVDITTITMSITKHNFQVNKANDIAKVMGEAFNIATTGRKGPVLVDIPKDILLTTVEYIEHVVEKEDAGKQWNEYDIIRLANIINSSEKPIIYSGGGVIGSGASTELLEFAEKGDIPVANSLMGLGGFPRDHCLSLGLVGMHGLKETNLAVSQSDLIIAIGSRFSDRVIGNATMFGPKAKVIQLDIDGAEIGKNKNVDDYLVGSMKEILAALIEKLDTRSRKEWISYITSLKQATKAGGNEWSGISALEVANKVFTDAIVATDVGQHQMWTAQHWKFLKPRTFLTSGGLGTMGFGLGAALGAKLANPEETVLLVTGDGSFRMNSNEMGTLTKYKVPVIILLFNNHTLGMVRQWQGMFSGGRFSETDLGDEVDFTLLANAYGINGARVKDDNELEIALLEAKKSGESVVIECEFSKDQWVYPIVPSGMAINDMIYEKGEM